jgi:uncharacterized protein (TIRG00374 family)
MKSVFVKAAISVGILCAVFYFLPVSKVFAAISIANPLWVIAGVFLQILLRILNAFRMQAIANAQHLDTGYQTMMRIVFTSTFYNLLVPGALAGGVVTYVKYRQQGVKSMGAVANIYANKSLEVIIVSLSAPLFWLIDKGFSLHLIVAYGLTMVIGFCCGFALLFGRFGNLQWLESKIKNHGQSVVHRKLAALFRQVMQIGQISNRAIVALIAYSSVFFLFAALAIICFGHALDHEIGLLPILWIYPVIYLLGMLPISISNIGVREVSMLMLLAPYGVATTDAIAWSFLMYSGPLSCALIGLILEAENFWLRKRGCQAIGSTGCQVAAHSNPGPERDSNEEKSD